MAHKKAGGSAKNLTDSNAQYLGVKRYAGEAVQIGDIIVRQRGTKMVPGRNVMLGKDHTIFASAPGTVQFRLVRATRFDGTVRRKSAVDVVSSN
jgi:large subunit ribosomal protein L27